MQSLRKAHEGNHDFAYWGEREDWLIAATRHRDSGLVAQSNFAVLQGRLEAGAEPGSWAIESFGHWLVGHGEWLLVKPGTAAARLAQEAADEMADYPLLDEEDYDRREYEAYLETIEEALRQYLWQHGHTYDYLSHCGEIADVVYGLCDNGGYERADEIGYSGVEDFWPSGRVLWAGLLEYRRRERKGRKL